MTKPHQPLSMGAYGIVKGCIRMCNPMIDNQVAQKEKMKWKLVASRGMVGFRGLGVGFK